MSSVSATRKKPCAVVSKYVSTYVDVEVDIDLDDLDADDMAVYLREHGWCVSGPGQELDITSFEYRLWDAHRQGRVAEVKRLLADMIYERIGRIL